MVKFITSHDESLWSNDTKNRTVVTRGLLILQQLLGIQISSP